MATKKRQKKSDTERMNDALREKAGVSKDNEEVEELYLEGWEILNEFLDDVIADAEEKKAAAKQTGNEEALKNADEGETAVGELAEAFHGVYEALGEALGIDVIEEDGGSYEGDEDDEG